MFDSQYNDPDEDPKQKLCINEESENEQNGEEIKQNYNYPYLQPNPQQQFHNTNPPPQYQNNYQQNNFEQYEAYVQVVPENAAEVINPELFHEGQKKAFTLSIVAIWIFQILIELLLLIKKGVFMDAGILIPCFVTALLIMISTVYENHPINKRNEVSYKDQILFFIYFAVDIFSNFAIYYIIHSPDLIFFIIAFRVYQFGNLICSMYTLVQSERELRIRSIIVITLIPFGVLMIFAIWIAQWRRSTNVIFVIPISWQVVQFALSFNLIRVINEIYSKQNKRIDINNIYTGFILFKYSYYLPS